MTSLIKEITCLQVPNGARREVFEPEAGVGKLGYLLVGHPQGLHDLPLELDSPGFGFELGLFALRLVLQNGWAWCTMYDL